MKESVREKTSRKNGHSMQVIIWQLNGGLIGWFGYFRHCHPNVYSGLDSWIRMRLRSILRKREGRKGRGRGLDHLRYRNQYFADLRLFSLSEAQGRLIQSIKG